MIVTFEGWPLLLASAILLSLILQLGRPENSENQQMGHGFSPPLHWSDIEVRYWQKFFLTIFRSLPLEVYKIPAVRIHFCRRIATAATAHSIERLLKCAVQLSHAQNTRLIPGVVKLIYFYE